MDTLKDETIEISSVDENKIEPIPLVPLKFLIPLLLGLFAYAITKSVLFSIKAWPDTGLDFFNIIMCYCLQVFILIFTLTGTLCVSLAIIGYIAKIIGCFIRHSSNVTNIPFLNLILLKGIVSLLPFIVFSILFYYRVNSVGLSIVLGWLPKIH